MQELQSYDDFYYDCWENVGFEAVTEEKYNSNTELIQAMTYDLYRLYQLNPSFDYKVAARVLRNFFENLKVHGLR